MNTAVYIDLIAFVFNMVIGISHYKRGSKWSNFLFFLAGACLSGAIFSTK